MNNPLFLFVGKSASGKSTIANIMEFKYNYKQVWSYTTRPKRCNGEKYHLFVSEEEFNTLDELAAYTEYNGYRYCATFKQLEECNIYVIDVCGVEHLIEKYKDNKRQIVIIYFDSTVHTRINRMINRHDSDTQIVSRLLEDEEYDWYSKLERLVWHYSKLENRWVELYKINANVNEANVLEQVLYYMNKVEE